MRWNPIDLGGTFIGAEWERLGSVFGMDPHRLGGRMEIQGGLSGNIWGRCWDGTP